MDAIQFAFWLNGYAELGGGPPTAEQWEVIKEHLNLVFTKVTEKAVTTPAKAAPLTLDAIGKLCLNGGSLPKGGATYCLPTTLDAMKAKEEPDPFQIWGSANANAVILTC